MKDKETEKQEESLEEIFQRHQQSGTLRDAVFIRDVFHTKTSSAADVSAQLDFLISKKIDLNQEYTITIENGDIEDSDPKTVTLTLLAAILGSALNESGILSNILSFQDIKNYISKYNLELEHPSIQLIFEVSGVNGVNIVTKNTTIETIEATLKSIQYFKYLNSLSVEDEINYPFLREYLDQYPELVDLQDAKTKMPIIGIFLNCYLSNASLLDEMFSFLQRYNVNYNQEYTITKDSNSFTVTPLSHLLYIVFENRGRFSLSLEEIQRYIATYALDSQHASIMHVVNIIMDKERSLPDYSAILAMIEIVSFLNNGQKDTLHENAEIFETVLEKLVNEFLQIFKQKTILSSLGDAFASNPQAIHYVGAPAIKAYLSQFATYNDTPEKVMKLFKQSKLNFNQEYIVSTESFGEVKLIALSHLIYVLYSRAVQFRYAEKLVDPRTQELISSIIANTQINDPIVQNSVQTIFKLFLSKFTESNSLDPSYIINVHDLFSGHFKCLENYKELVSFLLQRRPSVATALIIGGNYSISDKIEFIKQAIKNNYFFQGMPLSNQPRIETITYIMNNKEEAVAIVKELLTNNDKKNLYHVLLNVQQTILEYIKKTFQDNEDISQFCVDHVFVYRATIDINYEQEAFKKIFDKREQQAPAQSEIMNIVLEQLKERSNLDLDDFNNITKQHSVKTENNIIKFYDINPDEQEYNKLLQLAIRAKITIKISLTDSQGRVIGVSTIGADNPENPIELIGNTESGFTIHTVARDLESSLNGLSPYMPTFYDSNNINNYNLISELNFTQAGFTRDQFSGNNDEFYIKILLPETEFMVQ